MTGQIDSNPDFFARVDEACRLLLRGESESALELIEQLQVERPNAVETIYLLGVFAVTMDELGRGLILIEEAHHADPECLEYSEALANLHTRVGNLTEGLYYAKLSTTLEPHPHARNLLPEDFKNYFESLDKALIPRHHINGLIKMAHHQYEEAAREFDRQIQLVPQDANVRRDYADALLANKQFETAINQAAIAVETAPDDTMNQFVAGRVCQAIGTDVPAAFHFKNVLADKDAPLPIAAAAFTRMSGLSGVPETELAELKQNIRERWELAEARPKEATPSAERKQKIHVAYLSNGLASADLAAFLGPILRMHDRSKFEVHLYEETQGQSTFKQQMANLSDASRYAWNLDDETAAIIIGGDEMDILVDLCLPEADNRAGIFAMQPSLIQIGFAGISGPGLPWINHIVGDAANEQAVHKVMSEGQQFHATSPGLWSVTPSSMLPDVTPLPCLESGEITFGAICDLAGVTEQAVDAYTQALKALPNSRLLFGATGHIDGYPRRRIGELFAGTGVADRVAVYDENRLQDRFSIDHEYWRLVDVLLTPGPVYQPTRLTESLWMGIPIVALPSETIAGCTAASVLAAAGKEDWSTGNVDEFVAKASALCEDRAALSELRQSLRTEMSQSDLFKPITKVRALEALYQELIDARDKSFG
tara:strand:+ start:1285 stop:3243 length:1959 start_codon:yes stop_codon:yes gene_type:complete